MEIFVFFMQVDEDFLQKWQKVFLQLALQGSQPPLPLLLKTFGMSEQSSSPVMRGLNPLSKPLTDGRPLSRLGIA